MASAPRDESHAQLFHEIEALLGSQPWLPARAFAHATGLSLPHARAALLAFSSAKPEVAAATFLVGGLPLSPAEANPVFRLVEGTALEEGRSFFRSIILEQLHAIHAPHASEAETMCGANEQVGQQEGEAEGRNTASGGGGEGGVDRVGWGGVREALHRERNHACCSCGRRGIQKGGRESGVCQRDGYVRAKGRRVLGVQRMQRESFPH